MKVNKATINELNELAKLFDGYRVFYQQSSDIGGAQAFLRQRIENNESVIFLARDDDGKAVGFTQLYPTFSSVSMASHWVLNDLFVVESARKSGVAKKLMQTAEDFAVDSGANGLSLSTATNNDKAQALYEQRGWNKVTKFYHYNKSL